MNKWIIFTSVFVMGLVSCANADERKELLTGESAYGVSERGVVAVCVCDLKSGQNLLEFNERKRLVPASLTKIFTTGAAVDCLGPEFRFETKIYKVSSGHNTTQLLVKGGGDPTLGSDRWKETTEESVFKCILSALKKNNITSIYGLLIDDSWLAGLRYPSKRNWEDMGNYYGAPPAGLSFKENTFKLTLSSPRMPGKMCSIVNIDPQPEKALDCYVRSSTVNKDSAYIYGHPLMDRWYVSGSIPAGRKAFVIKGALSDPAMTFGRRLKRFLINQGVQVNGLIVKADVDSFAKKKLLCCVKSPELTDIIKVVNTNSNNLFADHLFLQLAKANSQVVSWDNASRTLEAFWGVRIKDFSGAFFDGSGLSPFNRFSPADMVGALTYLNASEYKDVFEQSLSVAGSDGTLKYFFDDEELNASFIGKSGSMNGVLCYCGYIETRGGRDLAVCVMVNGFDESFAQVRDKIAALLVGIIENR